MKRRVVVTGVGVISSLGNDVDTFWNNIKNGKNGISLVEKFDVEKYPAKVASVVKDFDAAEVLDKKEAKRMDRVSQFAVCASLSALENAGLKITEENAERVGVILGSGIGGFETFEEQHRIFMEKGPSRVSPFFVPMMITNMPAAQISIFTGAKGKNETIVTACASGTNAIGDAFRAVQCGEVDAAITGGSEASVTAFSMAGFCALKALSCNENPETACRPFDKNRDGFIMGEGAGILVLEEYEFAKNRGANIIAEVVGYGATDDAYHITAPAENGEGAARAMKVALDDAKIMPYDIEYINAHGTSTYYNDKFESAAITSVFGGSNPYVSSTKSMTGHLLGAAGGVEAIICALALKDGFVPPNINFETPDEECSINIVKNKGIAADIKYAMSNSLGFGGHNASVILKKFEG